MPDYIPPIHNVTQKASSAHEIHLQKQKIEQHRLQQINAKGTFAEECQSDFEDIQIQRNFKDFKELKSSKKEAKELKQSNSDVEEAIEETKKSEEAATRFSKKDPELKSKILILLRSSIQQGDSPEEILKKVLEFYPDHTLADEAFEYLLETSRGSLHQSILLAHDLLIERYRREVVAGRNIRVQSQEFSEKGLGSPTALRDMYRDITGNPRKAMQLFNELSKQFPFAQMKFVIDFLLHSLGADLKAKGPSISRGELSRLIEETRSLQAILGVYRFFHSRMPLLHTLFGQAGLTLPSLINFESLSQEFMKLLQDRYISSDRILLIGQFLGISDEIAAQIAIYMQYRDAIRQVSPKLYKSEKHKEELLETFIDTLEELEDKIDEEENEEEE
ncbi:MAG TPA: type III secretion system gatekeeper subunit SctW [Chlamydiales bacterium]|nr:type III secretion system gatekeeper subunit SctW [Chlamydiales bacterium]